MAGTAGMLCLIILTILFPPLGVFLISGCSVDFLINIMLTILGYLPGHIHAFYLEYVYYQNRAAMIAEPAPGVYSDRIQRGAHPEQNYGTIA
ncbi:YqaE/Pmp3 family membrane protein [Aspergillus undulatus]|uniref:YqaE/Pmp3 family membrane protein n=1 Tax=Aspergillus undulatus TaxID=1810928 RepID=UPI003CCDAB7C